MSDELRWHERPERVATPLSKHGYSGRTVSSIITQIIGICVSEQLGTAVQAQRDELSMLRWELDKRWKALADRLDE